MMLNQTFMDALRVVHSTNKFEFNGLSSPTITPLAPGAISPITPANASDIQAIVMSLLGTPLTTSAPAIPPTLSSPTGLPLLANQDIKMDEQALKLLTASAFPGSTLPNFSQADLVPQNLTQKPMTGFPMINNLVASTAAIASTSRPDKLNLTPPKMNLDKNSDDSDDSNSRSVSRAGGSSKMNLDDQDRKKLERKRARNRQAASKCRQKKMDRIKELEEQVNFEKQRAARLDTEMDQLQNALTSFQQIVQQHSSSGCPTFCRS